MIWCGPIGGILWLFTASRSFLPFSLGRTDFLDFMKVTDLGAPHPPLHPHLDLIIFHYHDVLAEFGRKIDILQDWCPRPEKSWI